MLLFRRLEFVRQDSSRHVSTRESFDSLIIFFTIFDMLLRSPSSHSLFSQLSFASLQLVHYSRSVCSSNRFLTFFLSPRFSFFLGTLTSKERESWESFICLSIRVHVWVLLNLSPQSYATSCILTAFFTRMTWKREYGKKSVWNWSLLCLAMPRVSELPMRLELKMRKFPSILRLLAFPYPPPPHTTCSNK